jgi:hypothetical protein
MYNPMKILKVIGVAVSLSLLVYIMVCFFTKGDYTISRNVTINTSLEKAFEEVILFENWTRWSPWQETDNTIVNTYFGTPGEPGSGMSWTSKKSGNGKQIVTAVEPGKLIKSEVFFEDYSPLYAQFEFEEKEGAVSVTWSASGHQNFWGRPLTGLMEYFIGNDYERGLQNLKKLL